jgi:anti-anti-sigma factor
MLSLNEGLLVARSEEDDVYVLTGELDLHTVGSLLELVPPPSGEDLILDMGEVAFIDSSGVRALFRVAEELRPGHLRIRNLSPHVRSVLELRGIAAARNNVIIER